MKKTVFILLCIVISLSSCYQSNNRQKKEDDKSKLDAILREYDCITYDSFTDYKYSYKYEEVLPCNVVIDHLIIDDIINKNNDDVYSTDGWIGESDSCCCTWIIANNNLDSIAICTTKDMADLVYNCTKSEIINYLKYPIVVKINQVKVLGNCYMTNLAVRAELIDIILEND